MKKKKKDKFPKPMHSTSDHINGSTDGRTPARSAKAMLDSSSSNQIRQKYIKKET